MRRAAIVVVAFAVAVLRLLPISDPDYHWHLATGRYIVEHRAIPSVDPFSHTALGARWKFVDWLSDVVMFLVHRVLGDGGNQLLFAALGALGVALAAERARRSVPRASAWMLGALTLTLGAALSFRVSPRPQTALFPLVAALFLALDAARTSPRVRWVPPLIVVLWQNLHSSGALGAAIVLAYFVEALVARRDVRAWAMVALASCLALFVAVRPLERLRAGFDHLGDARVAQLFPEWGSPLRPGVLGAWVLAAFVLLLLSGIGAAARAGALGAWLAAAMLAVVGMTSARFLPLAAIALAPLAAEGLVQMGERLRERPVAAIVGLLAVVGLAEHAQRPGLGLARDAFPEGAVRFLRDHDLRGKLFNDFHFGGYLIWSASERTPVFVDGRSMALYGVDFVREAATAVDAKLDALVDRHGVSLIVIPPDRRMGGLQRRPGFSLVYFDDAAAVLVRDAEQPGVASLAYRALTPGRWFDVDALRAEPGRVARAAVELQRAQREAPDSSIVAVYGVTVAIAAGDWPRADAALADAEARFPNTLRTLRARLIRCMSGGDKACACQTADRITRSFPNNTFTGSAKIVMGCQ